MHFLWERVAGNTRDPYVGAIRRVLRKMGIDISEHTTPYLRCKKGRIPPLDKLLWNTMPLCVHFISRRTVASNQRLRKGPRDRKEAALYKDRKANGWNALPRDCLRARKKKRDSEDRSICQSNDIPHQGSTKILGWLILNLNAIHPSILFPDTSS